MEKGNKGKLPFTYVKESLTLSYLREKCENVA